MAAGMDRRSFIKTAAVATAGLATPSLLAGCGSSSGGAKNGNGQGLYSTDITVSEYPVTALCLPYIVGMDDGIFKKHQWQIKDIVGGSGGGTAVRNIVVGDLPVGEMELTAAVQAWTQGAPIKVVGGCCNSVNDQIFVTRQDVKFDSMSDLIGKRVGYTNPASGSQAILSLTLDRLGLTKNVETVATGGLSEGFTLLDSGNIDFTISLTQLFSQQKSKYKVAWTAGQYIPKFTTSVVLASNKFLNTNSQLLREYLQARAASCLKIQQDPNAAAAQWAKAAKLPLAGPKAALKGFNLKETFLPNGFNKQGIDAALQSMELLGQLETPASQVPLNKIIDQRFVPSNAKISL